MISTKNTIFCAHRFPGNSGLRNDDIVRLNEVPRLSGLSLYSIVHDALCIMQCKAFQGANVF